MSQGLDSAMHIKVEPGMPSEQVKEHGLAGDTESQITQDSELTVPIVAQTDSSAQDGKSPKPVAPRPTIGGFIEDDDDDDDSEEEGAGQATKKVKLANGDALDVAASVKSSSQAPSAPLSHATVPNASANGDHLQSGNPPVNLSAPTPVTDDASTSALQNGDAGETSQPAQDSTLPDLHSAPLSTLKVPLPHDIVGQLELRIRNDPIGDCEAWLELIKQHRLKERYDEARRAYDRFFQIFPTAADQWLAYAQMEQEIDDIKRLEDIFNVALIKVQNVPLWSMYIDHVRRRNDITTDNGGRGREIITSAYAFVISQVGNDPDAGQIWQDYLAFLKSGPGVLGGTGWQDSQKKDKLRPIYQQAVCIPVAPIQSLWKEYSDFENLVNKISGRKTLQEKSPSNVTARHCYAQLQRIMSKVQRGVIPRLPPLPGFADHEEHVAQVSAWREWIAFERSDPLVLQAENNQELYYKRVLHVYQQAVMPLRFCPEMWFEAVQFCSEINDTESAADFLSRGCEANPESALLAFARADSIEQSGTSEEGETGAKILGDAVRAPYDVTLNALYAQIKQNTEREQSMLARIEEQYAAMPPESNAATPEPEAEQNDDLAEDGAQKPLTRKAEKEMKLDQVRKGTAVHFKLLSMVITYVCIGLMRAMRRIQGKGKPGETLGGMRQIFMESRKRGRVLGDFYVAGALLEHHCYHDPAALKIFERGLKLFPEDESFTLEYIKHLINTGDVTNARAVFETTVSRITSSQTPEGLSRAKVLYHFFHDFEAKYGEHSQIRSIEARMARLYPQDPKLALFAKRFCSPEFQRPHFDPCQVQLVLSPTQTRMKVIPPPAQAEVVESTEAAQPAVTSLGYKSSPKRPLDESDMEVPARKMVRGDSPLKGAAGRRQQQQRQAREQMGSQNVVAPAYTGTTAGPKPLPQVIYNLLGVMPPARQWTETRFDPQKMVDLLRGVDMSRVPSMR